MGLEPKVAGTTAALDGKVAVLDFTQQLTNAGGNSTLNVVYEGICADSCQGITVQVTSNVSSTVTTSPPPAPPAPSQPCPNGR